MSDAHFTREQAIERNRQNAADDHDFIPMADDADLDMDNEVQPCGCFADYHSGDCPMFNMSDCDFSDDFDDIGRPMLDEA